MRPAVGPTSLRSSMRVLLLPLLVLAVRGEAGAQVVATSFEELRPLVKPGDTIFVDRGERTEDQGQAWGADAVVAGNAGPEERAGRP